MYVLLTHQSIQHMGSKIFCINPLPIEKLSIKTLVPKNQIRIYSIKEHLSYTQNIRANSGLYTSNNISDLRRIQDSHKHLRWSTLKQ